MNPHAAKILGDWAEYHENTPMPPGRREPGRLGFTLIYSIREASRRHDGFAIVVFADAHVAGMKFQPLFFDENDDALRRWNHDHEPHREVLTGGQ